MRFFGEEFRKLENLLSASEGGFSFSEVQFSKSGGSEGRRAILTTCPDIPQKKYTFVADVRQINSKFASLMLARAYTAIRDRAFSGVKSSSN